MAKTNNYDRPKLSGINDTGMAMTLLVGEKPDAPTAIGGTGTTAELDARVQADADESGGVDVQDLWKVEALPAVAVNGGSTIQVTVTPIKGDGTEGTPQVITVTHPENMDIWQAAAGRARQA